MQKLTYAFALAGATSARELLHFIAQSHRRRGDFLSLFVILSFCKLLPGCAFDPYCSRSCRSRLLVRFFPSPPGHEPPRERGGLGQRSEHRRRERSLARLGLAQALVRRQPSR